MRHDTPASRRQSAAKPLALTAAGGLLLLAGCGTGQIGGEVSGGLEGLAGAGCEVVSEQSVPDSEITSLGLSGKDARGLLDGDYETSLAWGPSETQMTGVEVKPKAGSSQIHVSIQMIKGSTKLLDVEFPDAGGLEGGPAIAPLGECRDLLSVDAEVTIRTDNGALDDTFLTTFVLDSKNLARTTIPLTPGELEGSFDATAPADRPNAMISQVALSLNVTPSMVSGEISGGLEENDGQVASYAGLLFGNFPAQNTCSSGLPLDPMGSLSAQANAATVALHDFDLTFSTGETTTISLQTEVLDGCYDPSGQGEVILNTRTIAVSADGNIDGTWSLESHVALDAQGEPTSVQLLRQAYLADTYAPGTFADQTGIGKFPVDPNLEGTFSFSVSDDLTDELPASGEITVMEVTPADCGNQEPIDLPGGGVAAPGCSGSTIDEIGGALLRASSGG